MSPKFKILNPSSLNPRLASEHVKDHFRCDIKLKKKVDKRWKNDLLLYQLNALIVIATERTSPYIEGFAFARCSVKCYAFADYSMLCIQGATKKNPSTHVFS